MSGGKVPLWVVVPRIEAAINASLKGIVQVSLGDGVVEFTENKKVAHLRFDNVQATDDNGNVIARVPKANVALSGPALMNGEFAPMKIEVVGASALVVRRKDGGLQLGLQVGYTAREAKQEAASPGVTKAVLEAMPNPKPDDLLSRHLTRIAIVDVNAPWVLTLAGVLLAHTAMCSGAFGLLSYFEFHKDKEVVTYDDIGIGISYFYGKEK